MTHSSPRWLRRQMIGDGGTLGRRCQSSHRMRTAQEMDRITLSWPVPPPESVSNRTAGNSRQIVRRDHTCGRNQLLFSTIRWVPRRRKSLALPTKGQKDVLLAGQNDRTPFAPPPVPQPWKPSSATSGRWSGRPHPVVCPNQDLPMPYSVLASMQLRSSASGHLQAKT